MILTIGECNNYLKDVAGQVQDVLYMHTNFGYKHQILKLKIKLRRRLEVYSREKSKVELATLRLYNVPKETLRKLLKVELVNAVLLRGNLKQAFEGVFEAAVELKFVAKDAKISFKDELATIGVNVDRTFEDQYLKLDNKLTTLYKLKKIGEYFEDLSSGNNLDQPRALPRKLMKVEVAAGKATGKAGTSSTFS